MIVDGEGGDLLDELEKVDGAVEERGLEFAFEVDVGVAGFDAGDVASDVDQGDDVDGELAEDGAHDVEVEDFGLGAFFGETFTGLGGRG